MGCAWFTYFCSMMRKKNTVIVCPLDWGLGHATRMVPVIESFIRENYQVVIAADNRPLAFLKLRFPNCIFEQLPGYQPNYPTRGFLMPLAMMAAYPQMIRSAGKARKTLAGIVEKHRADVVVSDNRYELSMPGVYHVFITHQIHIQTVGWQKIFQPFIDLNIRKYINRYHELWIPDEAGEHNLSGILAHPLPNLKPKTSYIGLLSRFSEQKVEIKPIENDIVIILSGPEPQRTLLEEKFTSQALKTDLNILIIQGKPEDYQDVQIKNIRKISHLDDPTMAAYILGAQLIVSRPGYSTLMDLAFLQKKAAFVPTPGQTEQECLAHKLMDEKRAYCQSQNTFDLSKAYQTRHHYQGLSSFENRDALQKAIQSLAGKIALYKQNNP